MTQHANFGFLLSLPFNLGRTTDGVQEHLHIFTMTKLKLLKETFLMICRVTQKIFTKRVAKEYVSAEKDIILEKEMVT